MRARPLLVCICAVAALAFAGQAGAANHTVWAGPGFLKAAPAGTPKSADANLFFPRRLEVHVGDTVTFKSQAKFAYNVPQVFAPAGSNVIAGGGNVQNSGILDKKGYTFKFTKRGDY